MTKIRALKPYPYDNKQRRIGDVFDASDGDANTLVLTGLAEYVQKPGSYQGRAVIAEDDKPQPGRKGGRYARRDMRADD